MTFSPKRTAGPASASVASYKLTPLARSQLLAIHRYTEENFGRAQADKYHAGFHRIFGLIAKVPKMAGAPTTLSRATAGTSVRPTGFSTRRKTIAS